ncbi:Uma2 family endonuclease [Pendulispora brunnea]|uniref:Uma2 family endonuclease n=1 Tax=Pendulispora brunnea TaxID=2905690 RepID=A0ABZ2KK80_9BACT
MRSRSGGDRPGIQLLYGWMHMSTPPLRESPPIHRFTEDLDSVVRPLYREEFEKLMQKERPGRAERGEDYRVELLSGVLIEMGDASERHHTVVERVCDRLDAAIPEAASWCSYGHVPLTVDSMPLVDIKIVLPPDPQIEQDNPLALIEVADASLDKDRHIKAVLYAAAGVREYWIVDLQGEAIEVHRRPWANRYPEFRRYTDVVRYERGDRIQATVLFSRGAAVNDFLTGLDALH